MHKVINPEEKSAFTEAYHTYAEVRQCHFYVFTILSTIAISVNEFCAVLSYRLVSR